MRLICPECGRRTGANQYARRGDTCGAWIVTRKAAITRTRRGIVWFPQRTAVCRGILRRSFVGMIRRQS